MAGEIRVGVQAEQLFEVLRVAERVPPFCLWIKGIAADEDEVADEGDLFAGRRRRCRRSCGPGRNGAAGFPPRGLSDRNLSVNV